MKMRKIQTNHNKFLANFFSIFFSLFVTILALANFFQPGFNTFDDSSKVPFILEQLNSSSVLGASTEDGAYLYGCTESKPVIGWIDYSGQKVIRESLPSGENASACFGTMQEANQAGFVEKKAIN
jgi:hypothetical protein